MAKSQHFTAGATDWRQQIRINTNKTRWVIVIFMLLYLAVGLLIDLFIRDSGYFQAFSTSGANPYLMHQPNLWQTFINLVTLQVVPWATIVMLVVAAFSLWITYAFFDRMMLLGTDHVKVTENSESLQAQRLYNVVEEMKVAAGMKYMPKIFIINAEYMNAFASGYSEKSAMIAITRGLLDKLTRSELQAVMAHELSHIRHGDIKLTLTATMLSNLMLMAIDLLFYSVIFGGNRRRGRDGANILIIIILVARFVLPIINMLLLLYLSRTREYMADAGCVELQRDNEPLIHALLKIHEDHKTNADAYGEAYGRTAHENVRREAYIYDPVKMGIEKARGPSDWFSTHPGLEKRLAALGYKDSLT